jgi:hypothetical protein
MSVQIAPLGLTRRGLYLKLRRLGLAARADVDIQYLDTKLHLRKSPVDK